MIDLSDDTGHSDRPNGPSIGRSVVWNPCRGNHLGQRSCASAPTGRTYGRKRSDQNTAKTPCKEGAVHIWVHAERLVHKLDTFTDQHRAAQTRVRGLIWDFYADLKAYQLKPGKRRASALRARFDRIFLRRTGFATLDRLLARLHANKAELLMVLERSGNPAPHQRFGERHSLSGHTAQGQRRDAERHRPGLPRCFPQSRQDV